MKKIAKSSAIAALGCATVLAVASPALAATTDAAVPAQANITAGKVTSSKPTTVIVFDNQTNSTFNAGLLQGLDGSLVKDGSSSVSPGQQANFGTITNSAGKPTSANFIFGVNQSTGPAYLTGSFIDGPGNKTATVEYKADIPAANPKIYATVSWTHLQFVGDILTITAHNGTAPTASAN